MNSLIHKLDPSHSGFWMISGSTSIDKQLPQDSPLVLRNDELHYFLVRSGVTSASFDPRTVPMQPGRTLLGTAISFIISLFFGK